MIGLPSSVAESSQNIPQAPQYDFLPLMYFVSANSHNAEREKMHANITRIEEAPLKRLMHGNGWST